MAWTFYASAAAVLATSTLMVSPSHAQTPSFPSRQIRIVVPYPAGGPTDALARLLAAEMQKELGHVAIVENKPGASGALGTREVARAEPDGHTLVLGTNQTHVTNAVLLKEPGYDPSKDFAPVAGLADLQHALVVPKAGGAASVGDLVQRAKANPGKLNYGSSGLGSASHLAMELMLARTGTRMTHVPFRGAAPLALEIVAGRLDAAFATLPSVLGQIEAGEMTALALASPRPAPQRPLIPLLSASGVTGAEADAWLALFAPRATPAPVVARLSATIVDAMRRDDLSRASLKLGMVPNVRDAAALTTFLAAETVKWRDVVTRAGLQPQ